ncbi:MAG TPA: hypothetical protein VFI24_16245 [Pyrinomonadaceae bacterium]|nr:hypothetical protein [Pyrinomonadaceae bacterium]
MRNSEIERWTLEIIRRVENHQPVEDSRVELKRQWPTEHSKAARRLAGHANAARGERILWLIGVDEQAGAIGADYQEASDWLNRLFSNFDQLSPNVYALNVPTNSGRTVVALVFETARAPFVVRNPHFGSRSDDPISLEVPWRKGTEIRTATRADLLLLLSDASSLNALLAELEWNSDISGRRDRGQWQYRTNEFEQFFRQSEFSLLPSELQNSIREAYIATSNAQSMVRTFENATIQGRATLGNDMISARLEALPHIQAAVNKLRDFLGTT